jgi:hypothetical protein
MSEFTAGDWFVSCGLGAVWLGWQIVVVGGLPRALRPREEPPVEKDSAAAFQRFWTDQYGFIGLALSIGGLLLAFVGALR